MGQITVVKHETAVHLREKQFVLGNNEGVKHTMHTECDTEYSERICQVYGGWEVVQLDKKK